MISLNSKEIEYLGLKSKKNKYPEIEVGNEEFFDWMDTVNDGISRMNYSSYLTFKVFRSKDKTSINLPPKK